MGGSSSKKVKKVTSEMALIGLKSIPTVPLRGAFYSAASGQADRRRIKSAAQLAPSLNIFFHDIEKIFQKKRKKKVIFFSRAYFFLRQGIIMGPQKMT